MALGSGPSVRPRRAGHRLKIDDTVLRFETIDANAVVKRAAAGADLYAEVLRWKGLPSDLQVLALSCFAVTDDWPPLRLAQQTSFRAFRAAPAHRLLGAGHSLWPTETYVDGIADPRNEVHYDLVVEVGRGAVPDGLRGGPAERRAARRLLLPAFQAVFDLFGQSETL